MKLSDLFKEYCELDGVRIVRVLDLDIFFALRNSGRVADSIVARHLRKDEIEALENNKLKIHTLYEYAWSELEEWDNLFSESKLIEIVEETKARPEDA